MKNETKTTNETNAEWSVAMSNGIGKLTQLGSAALILEDEDGTYQPLGFASTISEAFAISLIDLKRRRDALEADRDPGMVPFQYKLWAQRSTGVEVVACWDLLDMGGDLDWSNPVGRAR